MNKHAKFTKWEIMKIRELILTLGMENGEFLKDYYSIINLLDIKLDNIASDDETEGYLIQWQPNELLVNNAPSNNNSNCLRRYQFESC